THDHQPRAGAAGGARSSRPPHPSLLPGVVRRRAAGRGPRAVCRAVSLPGGSVAGAAAARAVADPRRRYRGRSLAQPVRRGGAHARRWEAAGTGVGGAAEASPLPETRAAAESLGALVGEDGVTAPAALWAYEVQTARGADTKETAPRRYGVDSPAALRFFRL